MLIAFSFSTLQSALPERKMTIVSAYGWAEQSFALDSSSVFSIDQHGNDCKRVGDHAKCRLRFYLRLTHIGAACRLCWSSEVACG